MHVVDSRSAIYRYNALCYIRTDENIDIYLSSSTIMVVSILVRIDIQVVEALNDPVVFLGGNALNLLADDHFT